ncbi:MAG: glycosyltransferase family 2 protein [Acetobacteraceae bacterium]|jgi:glycosyltransferase involved in cell wall biosynthesis
MLETIEREPQIMGRLSEKATEWFAGAVARRPSVAVLIPCFNEEAAIGKVIADFHAALPVATIYVYDNNSTDRTMAEARAGGAVVRAESLQGKGHVVRRMFADIDADVYLLVDGDDTYDAKIAPRMMQLLLERQLDMVSAARDLPAPTAYRPGHKLGNVILTGMVRRVFGSGISDMLSGYRVFSRRFVKSFPALTCGFETETEFTVHALALNMPIAEMRAPYRGRPAGSQSKLNTFADGLQILREIVTLIEHERPLPFFSFIMAIHLTIALALGLPVIITFFHTGLVERLPTAVLSASFVLLAFLSLGCGFILESITRGRKELKRLAYLAIPPEPGC